MESIEATEKVAKVEEKQEDFLAYYAKFENKVHVFRDEVFPSLYKLDDGVEKHIHRCLEPDCFGSIGAANLRQSGEVLAWIGSTDSGLLWIDGFAQIEKSDWTTTFCLMIEDIARPNESITMLSHYCSEQANSSQLNRPEVILQSLIFQLIDRHYRKFTWLSCCEHCLTRLRFQEARDNTPKLWALFRSCLIIAEVPCLYIILDNIDTLWSKTCNGSEGVEKLEGLLHGLRELARNEERLCKALITSRLPAALECFSEMWLAPSGSTKQKIVSVPRRAQKGAKMFGPPKGIQCVPIRRKIFPHTFPDPEILLANVNKSDEEVSGCSEDEKEGPSLGSPEYADSDDDEEYGKELIQHSKDYGKYLDSPTGSGSEVDEAEWRESKVLADDDDDSDVEDNANEIFFSPLSKFHDTETVIAKGSDDDDSDADDILCERFPKSSMQLHQPRDLSRTTHKSPAISMNIPPRTNSEAGKDDVDSDEYASF